MKGLIYCKYNKPYLLSKNYEESLLFNLSGDYEIGERLILSNNERYKYLCRNSNIVGEVDYETKEFNLDEMSSEEKKQLTLLSGLSISEIRKKLKNESIGQALYPIMIKLYKKDLSCESIVEHKRNKYLKTFVEKEVFAPTSDKKVFYKGEISNDNPKLLLVLNSQEVFDLINQNINLIIRKKVKV